MTRIPYRQPDDQLPLQRKPGHPLGFVRTVQGKVAQLTKEVAGLKDRLRYKYNEGVPASYVGETVFSPESASFDLDVYNEGDNPANVQPVNYVVRDGQTQSVPIVLQGPGVFMARFIKVKFFQRYNDPDLGPMRLPIPIGKTFFDLNQNIAGAQLSTRLQTIKWHLFYDVAGFNELLRDRLVGINYFWNIIDRDSERQLSGDFIADTALLHQGYQNQVNGDLMEFDVPWLFERAGIVDFQFRLINPILQLAATSASFPFSGKDDRENNGTVRDQRVIVRVELHGTKHYSERDQVLREAV
jgi:hypothetical protein